MTDTPPPPQETTRSWTHAIDRHAALLAAPPNAPYPGSPVRRRGTVAAIHAGPPPTVDVVIGGTYIGGVRRLVNYFPAVNDVVYVDIIDGDPLVIGRQAVNNSTDVFVFPTAIKTDVIYGASVNFPSLVTRTGTDSISFDWTGGWCQFLIDGTLLGAISNAGANVIAAGSPIISNWAGSASYGAFGNTTSYGNPPYNAVLCGPYPADPDSYFCSITTWHARLSGSDWITFINSSGVTDFRFPHGLAGLIGTGLVIASGSQQVGFNSSSERWKQNIVDIANGGDSNPIWGMQPRTFQYIQSTVSVANPDQAGDKTTPEGRAMIMLAQRNAEVTPLPTPKVSAGLIAEEVVTVAEDCVTFDGDGIPLSLDTFAFLGYIVDALQHLKATKADA